MHKGTFVIEKVVKRDGRTEPFDLSRIESENLPRAVISDCRYRNELEHCAVAGFVPVHVVCEDAIRAERLAARGDRPLTAEEERHASENEVLDALAAWPDKHVIDNNGSFGHLYNALDSLMQMLGVSAIPSPLVRPSWRETFMAVAGIVARRSTCLRRKVGAVLVRENRIIATGYNGAPKGMAHCDTAGCLRVSAGVPSGERHELCRAVHAEENCVIQAATFGVSTVGADLYVTCHPCSLCARTLINAGVKRIYYAGEYPDGLAADLLAEAGVGTVRLG